MDYTQSRGNITELQCICKFMEFGIECSIPYGNGAKYDFIADINGDLVKIQCKSASKVDNGSFIIKTISQTTNTQKTTRHRYTKEQIDYFATSYKGKIYLIPVEECSTAKTLRTIPPSNGQTNYNKAEDYEIQKVLFEKYNLILLNKKDEEEQIKEKQYYCISCNNIEVSGSNKMCVECMHKSQRLVERPERNELKEMIRTIPFVQIAKKYDVSDKAIVKWCIAENLPSRKSDIRKYSDKEWEKI